MKRKKLLSILLTLAMVISILPSVSIPAEAASMADNYITFDGTNYEVDGSGDYATLETALTHCADKGTDGLLIQLGSIGTPLVVTELLTSSAANNLVSATYTGSLQIVRNYIISLGSNTYGLGVPSGAAVVFSDLTITINDSSNTIPYAVYVSGGSLSINDGTSITVSGRLDYGVYNDSGAVTVNGGTITATDTSYSPDENTGISSCGTGSLTVNGGTITVGGEASVAVKHDSTGNLTVTGGTISATKTGSVSKGIFVSNAGAVDISGGSISTLGGDGNSAALLISSKTAFSAVISGSANISGRPFAIFNQYDGGTATLTISGGNILSEESAICIVGNTLSVTGGTITASEEYTIQNAAGIVNISGGTIKGDGEGGIVCYGKTKSAAASLIITGSARIISAMNNTLSLLPGDEDDSASASIFGKTVSSDSASDIGVRGATTTDGYELNSSNYADAYLGADTSDSGLDFVGWASDSARTTSISTTNPVKISALTTGANDLVTNIYLKTTTPAVDPDYTVTGGESSFQVGGSGNYATLADALAVCTDDGADDVLTIQLGDGTISLKVNELPQTGNKDLLKNGLKAANYSGSVEIQNTGVDYGYGLVIPYTGVIFDGLTVTEKITSTTIPSYAVYVMASASLTVKGKTSITASSDCAHVVLNRGTFIMSGGQVSATASGGYGLVNEGTSTITGGSFTGSGNNSRCATNEGTLTISGGSFTSTGTKAYCIHNLNSDNGTGTLTITGGTFLSEGQESMIVNNAGQMSVTGGSFRATNTGDGVYGIYCKGGLLKIGGDAEVYCASNSMSSGSVYLEDNFASTFELYGSAKITGERFGIYCGSTVTSGNGAVYIHGGTVTANVIALSKNGTGLVTIADGTLHGKFSTIANMGTGTINMTGGTLSAESGIIDSSGGTCNISGGSLTSSSTNMVGITLQSTDGSTSLTLSGTTKMTVASGAVVSIHEQSGSNAITATIFGKTVHGSTNASLQVMSNRGDEISSSNYSNCAVIALPEISSFFRWTSDASLTTVSSAINGDTLSNLAADTYLETGSSSSVILVENSAGKAGNASITGLAAGKAYKVTMGGITFYSTEKGRSTTNPSKAEPLKSTELSYLINGSTYFVEEYSLPVVVLASGSLGTAGDKKITVDSGKKYKVTTTTDSKVYYVKADGTLSTSSSDAAVLNGTEIKGLTNGTTYKVEVYTADIGGGGVYVPPTSNSATVVVGDKTQTAGTVETTTQNGKTTTTVTLATDKLKSILDSAGSGATITLPITTGSATASGRLDGQAVKDMEKKNATLVINTGSASYALPASDINIDAVSGKFGSSVSLSDIVVNVSISTPSDATAKVVANAAVSGGFSIQVPAVEFTVSCTYGGQTVEVSTFNSYVERMIAIPDGVDPKKITTGIVVEPDGTTHHVPTEVVIVSGKYFAKINSLTNSVYSVIYNPVEFSDVASHWAKASINNMGSRVVVNGVGNNNYDPDRSITRAEMASIMVKALGLEPGTGTNCFGDVSSSAWYCGYIETASSYGIIKGYSENTFGPNDTITREQAMAMIARAMKITGLNVSLTDSETSSLLAGYTDCASAADYAKGSIAACLKTGIVSGTSKVTISPKDDVTRAEVAAMVERLLQKSGLI